MDAVCRLCAKEKTSKQLGYSLSDRTLNIQQKLIDCCRWTSIVPIEYDSLPKRICNPCYRKLEMSWSFAESVAQAQQELHSIVDEEEKPPLAPIEHVNITIVEDEQRESANVFDQIVKIDSIDANAAAVEPTAKLEVVIKQDEIEMSDHHVDYDGDSDDIASLPSIDHDIFGTAVPTKAAATASAAASAGSSKSQPSKSKATKKKPKAAKDTDTDSNRKKSQQLPASRSRICDICGKELLNADGLKLHLKIHLNERDYECKTCGKRFIHRKNLVVRIQQNKMLKLPLQSENCSTLFRTMKIFTAE